MQAVTTAKKLGYDCVLGRRAAASCGRVRREQLDLWELVRLLAESAQRRRAAAKEAGWRHRVDGALGGAAGAGATASPGTR